jgi:hypothetical protein
MYDRMKLSEIKWPCKIIVIAVTVLQSVKWATHLWEQLRGFRPGLQSLLHYETITYSGLRWCQLFKVLLCWINQLEYNQGGLGMVIAWSDSKGQPSDQWHCSTSFLEVTPHQSLMPGWTWLSSARASTWIGKTCIFSKLSLLDALCDYQSWAQPVTIP